jgi:hypothetical protein
MRFEKVWVEQCRATKTVSNHLKPRITESFPEYEVFEVRRHSTIAPVQFDQFTDGRQPSRRIDCRNDHGRSSPPNLTGDNRLDRGELRAVAEGVF